MRAQRAPLVLISSVLPLYTVSLPADRILISGAVHVLTALAGIVLAFFVTLAGFGMIGIPISVGWTFIAKELVFMPMYVSSNVGRAPTSFYRPLITGGILFSVALATSWSVGEVFKVNNYAGLGAMGLLVTIPYGVTILAVVATEEERALATRLIQRCLHSCGFRKVNVREAVLWTKKGAGPREQI